MIAGFTVVLNGLENGYPFVEAIRSALELCEEVTVSEGFSRDGTYEVLARLAQEEPRIRLRRDRWDTSGRAGAPFRNILNTVRRDLTSEVIYQFDANDILPPEDVSLLRELPEVYPHRDLFGMPYHEFMGRYWIGEYFRFRLFRNRPTIWAIADGWTFGHHLSFSDLMRPRNFRKVLGRVALAVLQDRVPVDLPEMTVHLPRPIFHYYGLFPESFLGKMEAKVWLQDNPRYRDLTSRNHAVAELIADYRSTHDYDRFWKGMIELQRAHRARGARLNKEFQFVRFVPDEQHPAAIRPWLGAARYEPRLGGASPGT
jgi:hypothetical protein